MAGNIMTVREFVERLTPVEREQHKELIDECLAREAELDGIAATCRKNLEELADSVPCLLGGLRTLSEMAQTAVKVGGSALSSLRRQKLITDKVVGSA